MSSIVKRVRRDTILAAFKDHAAAKSFEAVINYCIGAIPDVVQYETPADNDTITVNYLQASEFYNVWLVTHAPAGHATGVTIVMPPANGLNAALPSQEVIISTEHNLTSLTIDANGGTMVSSITSLSAGSSVRFKFYGGKWFKI